MSRPASPLDDLVPRALRAELLSATPDETETRILDAALEVLAERGTEAATMPEIASRAGVGRATVFRRFGDKDALFERVVARQVQLFLLDIAKRFAEVSDPAERISEAFAACLRLGHSPLLRSTSTEQRAALLAALTRGTPAPIDLCRQFVAAHITRGQRSGHVRQGDPDVLADGLIRMVAGFLLLPSDTLDPADEASVRRVALGVIAPIVLP